MHGPAVCRRFRRHSSNRCDSGRQFANGYRLPHLLCRQPACGGVGHVHDFHHLPGRLDMTSRRAIYAAALLILVLAPGLLTAQSPAERFWPQWRGPFATGVSRTATPPVEWSETKNVRWKVPIPGRSSSTPVIWGDRIFLLT